MIQKKRTRPTYSQEFKDQAVAKYLELGLTKTCKELGISAGSLRKWIDKSNYASPTSEKPSYEDLEAENRRLKKELGYVSEINNILKKSTAIFSSKEMDGI